MDIDDTSDFDILRNKKIVDMERQFQKRLYEIENKHKDYFLNRPAKSDSDEHDRLHNHYIYHQFNDQARINWLDNSDLDQDLRNDVEKAFKEIFVP